MPPGSGSPTPYLGCFYVEPDSFYLEPDSDSTRPEWQNRLSAPPWPARCAPGI